MVERPKAWLAHPLTRGCDVDDPQTTSLRRRIIKEKIFLRRIYEEWYASVITDLPRGSEPVLELGSGAGFMNDFIPGLITSEVFVCPNIAVVLDAMNLPFADNSLRAVVMTDVLHHIPDVRRFFNEATRCVRAGGAIIMIEPWVTSWSRLIYSRFHHEPFEPQARQWDFPTTGPLSGANGALPWILFVRDREPFGHDFPEWEIKSIKPMMPFRYLVSGGFSMRSLVPNWSFGVWHFLEKLLAPGMDFWAMFARIVLVKKPRTEADFAP
jgi:SAM-dependent methyltransferase